MVVVGQKRIESEARMCMASVTFWAVMSGAGVSGDTKMMPQQADRHDRPSPYFESASSCRLSRLVHYLQ